MALNRSFRQIREHVELAKTWEAEKRVAAGRATVAAERTTRLKREIIEAEAKRQAREAEEAERRAVNEQYARERQLGTCPHCQRFLPLSEIDDHVMACREEAAKPKCPICGQRVPAKRLDYHVAKCVVPEWWAQGS